MFISSKCILCYGYNVLCDSQYLPALGLLVTAPFGDCG
jgi:hypothetical protein